MEGSVSLAELMACLETDEQLQNRLYNLSGNIRNTYIYNEAGSVEAWIAIQSYASAAPFRTPCIRPF